MTNEITTKIINDMIITETADGMSSCSTQIEQDTKWDEEGNENLGEKYVLIGKLEVARDARRQGLGRKLLRTCMKAIRANYPGMAIKLCAEPQDDTIDINSLVAFYESEGFYVEEAGEKVIMAA